LNSTTERFDLSTGPGTGQRLIFALFGIGQLVLSSVAFQRGGFFYGLIVLFCGLAAFCAAVFFVYRLNRRLVFLGPEGLAVEEGWHERRALAWENIAAVHLDPALTVVHAASGADIALHRLADQSEFIARLQAITAERQIPVAGAI
jgi:hypothetical protein|tara:strand:- start:717 stop:1154 length:438 start_codon:yes stop_codon:yes gene_type:complete